MSCGATISVRRRSGPPGRACEDHPHIGLQDPAVPCRRQLWPGPARTCPPHTWPPATIKGTRPRRASRPGRAWRPGHHLHGHLMLLLFGNTLGGELAAGQEGGKAPPFPPRLSRPTPPTGGATPREGTRPVGPRQRSDACPTEARRKSDTRKNTADPSRTDTANPAGSPADTTISIRHRHPRRPGRPGAQRGRQRRCRLGPVEIHRVRMTVAPIWTIASKLVSVLHARMAMRLNSLSF